MARVLLVFMTLIAGCYAQTCPGCGTVAPKDNYCAADLVIAMDYSKSMTNQSVYNLVQFVLQNFTNYLPISTTYVRTSIYGYGFQAFQASDVFTNYYNVCNQVQVQCGAYNQDGSSVSQLSGLFKFYAGFFSNSQRPYIPAKFVVFTAINDQANIEAAIPYTKNITARGSSIIIVGLNQTNPAWLRELSNTTYFFNFNDSVANLTQFLLNNVCTYDLTTPAPQTTPAPSGNPLSDEIGTECANDPPNLWLDIIVAIDNTSSMASGVSNIASTLSTLFYELNIAQNDIHHYTRVGIIFFDSEATIYANLTSYSSQDVLDGALVPLFSATPGIVETIDITKALQAAFAMFTDKSPGNQRNARKVVLLFASTYNPTGANGAIEVANQMKNMNYFIIGVDYNDANGLKSDLLKNITSPGMLFYASDGEGQSGKESLYNELLDAFSYANCMCPSTMIQLIAFNETTGNAKYYADCFQGDVAGSFAKFAELACEGKKGSLVSLNSQEKENFLYQNLQDKKLLPGSSSHFHIGLTSTNGSLNWYNYNKTQIPLGSYTNWASAPGTGDYCVYTENLSSNKWGWLTEACLGANPFSYICQYRACDADDDCEIDQLFQREQKQN